VWAALTTAEGLAAWFGNKGASIELRPGGPATLDFESGFHQDMRVERVEEPTVFGFTWQIYGLPTDDPRRTYVEFTLDPTPSGTRLTVVETGFAQLTDGEHDTSFKGNASGWVQKLDELSSYLDAS
jgi:uncharacterized protein YndB with AHSA1/START domain